MVRAMFALRVPQQARRLLRMVLTQMSFVSGCNSDESVARVSRVLNDERRGPKHGWDQPLWWRWTSTT